MQAGLAATLACLRAAQKVQALSAAVLLSCTLPIAPEAACETTAVPAPIAAATAAPPPPPPPPLPPPSSPAAPSPATTTRKRPRPQDVQQPPPQHGQQRGNGGAHHTQPAAAEEQRGSSPAKRAKRAAKEERRRQRQARRAAKDEKRRRRREQQQQAEQDAGDQGRQQQQQRDRQGGLLHAHQEADSHPQQPARAPMPGAAAAAAEPPAAAAAGAQAAAGARGAAAAAGQAQQQQEGPELYRFWSPLEVQRLLRCVEEPAFRREELGSEAMDWRAIATHFKRSVQAVRSKYRLEQLTKEDKASGQGPTRGGPRASISYGYMALFALASLPERSGTGEEVCAAVEAHGPFQPLLDRTFRQDSVGVPKWKQRIREELSHRSYFINTRQKRGGETIWQLESSNFDAMPPAQLKRLAQALPGLPLLGKRGLPNG